MANASAEELPANVILESSDNKQITVGKLRLSSELSPASTDFFSA